LGFDRHSDVDCVVDLRAAVPSEGEIAMGEAKRHAAERERLQAAITSAVIPRVAGAIRKLAAAASSHLGQDCYTHAALCQAMLAALGVPSVISCGFAAWRVGESDPSVIVHAPIPGMPPQPGGLPYHVWLEVGGTHILDITTWQLRSKAADLDRLDGGHTDVEWCPDYLFVEKKSVSTLTAVTAGHAGMYYYEQVPTVEVKIMETAPALDPADVEIAWAIYNNPDIMVFGPNDIKRGGPPHERNT
jgi:hypothetical protein